MSEARTDWLKHPLVNVVIGFILTGVLGTAITQHFLDRRAKETLEAQIALDRKKAVQQFSELNESRRVRAEILLRALRSADSDALKPAREEYEKAYVAWSVEQQGVLLLLRDLLAPEDHQLVKARLQEVLVGKIFNPLRSCLTAAYDQRSDRPAAIKTLDDCQVDELLKRSGTCARALASAVSDLAGAHSAWASEGQATDMRKRARDAIQQACP